MKLELAEDIREDAKTVAIVFADGIKDNSGKLIVPPIRHFIQILEIDPNLNNILFLREYEDGSAHRDSHHCFMRRSTDRDRELMKLGASFSLKEMSELIDEDMDIYEEATLMESVKSKLPPLIAIVDGDYYNSLPDRKQMLILFNLLLRYDPVKVKPRKPDIAIFVEELLIAGTDLAELLGKNINETIENRDSEGKPLTKEGIKEAMTPIHHQQQAQSSSTSDSDTEEEEDKDTSDQSAQPTNNVEVVETSDEEEEQESTGDITDLLDTLDV